MGNPLKLKIFITGIYRSGTTLISRILSSHSQLWVTYDSVHFMRFCFGRYNPIERLQNVEKLLKGIHNRILTRWNMEFDSKKAISKIRRFKRIDYNYIYDLVMEDLVSRYKKGAIGWAEKTNVCWEQIPNFLNMFPNGKVIHLLRDPRDVMCSYREMTYEPGFAYLDSAFCSLHSFSQADQFSQKFDKKRYYPLKYEDLLQDPLAEVKKVCAFLGIRFEPAMLDVKSFRDNTGQPWRRSSSFAKKWNTISKVPIGRWKKKATALEIFFVELINKESMKKYGYSFSAVNINKSDWNKLYAILNNDRLLSQRYQHWLRTAEGVGAYPSDPTKK